jgi:hypothetical protein
MARLFFPSSSGSVTCKRCGNDIPSDADNCPHCGADFGPGFGASKTAALSPGLRLPFGARREALSIPSPYPSVPEESELAGAGEQRWDMSKTVTLGAVALALVAGGVIYSQRGGSDDTARSEPPAGHSAYGAIDMKTARDAARPAPATAPAPAPVLSQSQSRSAAAASARQAPAAAAPTVAAREAVPAENASGRAAATLAGVTDNLQAARDAIERGDLTTARRRFSKIPASQLSASNVLRTQADLVALERARDGMLQTARNCEATGAWLCVRQNARDVLTIDASNAEAQTLVEHAIARSGWLNKNTQASAATHGAPRNNGQAVAAAPAAPGPRVAATLPPAATHRPAATVSAAQHARAVAAMGVPAPIAAPVRAAPPAPVVVTTMRTPVATPAVPEPARLATGSQTPLTSTSNTPPVPQQAAPRPSAPAVAPAFIPMPDGPDVSPARAPVRSSPATATARAPAQAEPEPATEGPGATYAPPVVRPLAPVTEAVPVRAGIASPPVAANGAPAGMQAVPRPPSSTVRRTPASGDNAASAAQPHAPAFNASNTDEEERAILESGWSKSKSPSSAQHSTPQ